MFYRFYPRLLPSLTAIVLALLCGACGKEDNPVGPTPSGTLKITGVSPGSGSTTGGTVITIGGTGFSSDASVTVGGVAATQVTFAGATTINAVISGRPAAGAADVVVTAGARSSTLANGFTFVAPSGANRPPVVSTITATAPRPNQPATFGNLGDVVALSASVSDSEATPDKLTFEWTGPGVFGAQAAATNWTLPSTASTPSSIVATLKVTETFVEGGITHRNVSAAGTYTVQLHDSQKEILDLGDDFLTLFSQSSNPTDMVLRGFSSTCDNGSGRNAEKADVDRSRLQYKQDFAKYKLTRVTPVSLNFRGSCPVPGRSSQRNVDACSSFIVHWEIEYIQNVDAERRIGTKEVTDGTDYVSAVLENNQWRLCHSDFVGTSVIPKLGLRRAVSW